MAREKFHNDLKPYAILIAGVVGDLENMDEEELSDLADSFAQPTVRNCWRYTYQAAQLFGDLVVNELNRRKVAPNV